MDGQQGRAGDVGYINRGMWEVCGYGGEQRLGEKRLHVCGCVRAFAREWFVFYFWSFGQKELVWAYQLTLSCERMPEVQNKRVYKGG